MGVLGGFCAETSSRAVAREKKSRFWVYNLRKCPKTLSKSFKIRSLPPPPLMYLVSQKWGCFAPQIDFSRKLGNLAPPQPHTFGEGARKHSELSIGVSRLARGRPPSRKTWGEANFGQRPTRHRLFWQVSAKDRVF